jgi:hypothetical protein
VGRPAVDEVGEDREASHPICQHVMKHDDQGTALVGEGRDQAGRPQRMLGWKRVGHDASRNPEKGLLVARRWTANIVDMSSDVELGIVDPDRPATARWCRHQLLA